MAIENAVEGCVRETFGALVAHWQARHARDPDVARVMRVVARDETRHAALAWAIAEWAAGRDARERERARVREGAATAMRRAAAELAREIVRAPAPALVHDAGVPPAAIQRAMVRALACTLWSAPSALTGTSSCRRCSRRPSTRGSTDTSR
jgi:hypothetical protein